MNELKSGPSYLGREAGIMFRLGPHSTGTTYGSPHPLPSTLLFCPVQSLRRESLGTIMMTGRTLVGAGWPSRGICFLGLRPEHSGTVRTVQSVLCSTLLPQSGASTHSAGRSMQNCQWQSSVGYTCSVGGTANALAEVLRGSRSNSSCHSVQAALGACRRLGPSPTRSLIGNWQLSN